MSASNAKLAQSRSAPRLAVRIRARDRDATRANILEAATTVFSQHGLKAARTDEIASLAGVTKGLLFHYFDSKELLFEAVLQRAYDPLREILNDKGLRSASPDDALRSLVEKLLAAMNACPQGPAIFLMESIQNHGEHYRKLGMPSIYRALEEVLRSGVRDGTFRKLNVAHAAINIVGLCSYYFCAIHNFKQDGGAKDYLSPQALSGHTREVLAFVKAGTAADAE